MGRILSAVILSILFAFTAAFEADAAIVEYGVDKVEARITGDDYHPELTKIDSKTPGLWSTSATAHVEDDRGPVDCEWSISHVSAHEVQVNIFAAYSVNGSDYADSRAGESGEVTIKYHSDVPYTMIFYWDITWDIDNPTQWYNLNFFAQPVKLRLSDGAGNWWEPIWLPPNPPHYYPFYGRYVGSTELSMGAGDCYFTVHEAGSTNRWGSEWESVSGFVYLDFDGGARAPGVSGITPASGPNSGSVNITNLAGAGFVSGATVKLTRTGESDILATDVEVVSETQITCTFDLTGAAIGQWNVVVRNPDGGEATLADGFTVTDGIAPVITSVSVGPPMVARGDMVRVSVDVTDNAAVTSVTADGTALANSGGTIWNGDIPADDALGTHIVTVIAGDAAGNSATDTSGSYKTARVFATANRGLTQHLPAGSASEYLFAVFGRVAVIDADVFEVNDGSETPVRVLHVGHTLQTGDYAAARGIWSPGGIPPTLAASHIVKLQ